MSGANFDIGHNIYTSKPRALIFHMHITYGKSFSNVATYKTLTFDLHLIVNNRNNFIIDQNVVSRACVYCRANQE